MMPKLDGYSVCKTLKENSDVPVIILTALENISDKITFLKLGADNYVMKPFSPKDLENRINSIFMKVRAPQTFTSSPELQIHSLLINKEAKSVYKNNEKIKLTKMEFNLLIFLTSKTNLCISRNTILKEVWSYTTENYKDTRVVDVHICRLRKKLENDDMNRKYIFTLRGKGYLFKH